MKYKVLVVDDDVATLKILQKYLLEKFDVITESSGYRFVGKLDLYDVDFILLDLEMPIVNGLQAFEAVLAHPRLKNVPVAFMSGVHNPRMVRKVTEKGAADCIIKTIPKDELVERVEKLIIDKKNRETITDVLILSGNVKELKSIKSSFEADAFKVKTVNTVMEVVDILKFYNPKLFVIGVDKMGNKPQLVYENLAEMLRSKSIRSIVIDKPYFDLELIDRAKKMFK